MKTTVKKFKYKVGDKVKYKEFDVIIKGMNYYSSSGVLTYLVKGYPLGHNGGITTYHYDELGFKIIHMQGTDYYYVDEYDLSPQTSTPGDTSKNYYLGQKVKVKIGSKEYIGTIEGFEKNWRLKTNPTDLPIRFYGFDNGHDGRYGSYCNYDENGNPINFTPESNIGYWFISPDQILETYPGFNTKSIDDVSTTKIPNMLDKTDKYDGIERIKTPSECYKPGNHVLKLTWNEIDDLGWGGVPSGGDEIVIKHQSARVLKSPSKKTKFTFIKK